MNLLVYFVYFMNIVVYMYLWYLIINTNHTQLNQRVPICLVHLVYFSKSVESVEVEFLLTQIQKPKGVARTCWSPSCWVKWGKSIRWKTISMPIGDTRTETGFCGSEDKCRCLPVRNTKLSNWLHQPSILYI